MRLFALLLVLLSCGVAEWANAHELRPAYLQVRQKEVGSYEMIWKVPARGGKRLSLDVRLPLARKIASAVGRTDYVRVALEDGCVLPIATSGASILSSTVRAAGCVVVPRECEGVPEGEAVEVLLYDEALPG